MEKKIFNFDDSKKAIREGMKKTEEDFKDFIKILLNKKSEPYMELGCVRVFQDVMITSNALNKMKYMQLEMDMKIGELSAKLAGGHKAPKKSSSKEKGVDGHNSASSDIGKKQTAAPAPMKGVEKNNKPETKNGGDKDKTQKHFKNGKEKGLKEEKCQLSSEACLDEVTIAMNDIHMVDTGNKKPVGQHKHNKCEEEEAAATNFDEKRRTRMILELYEMCEYHKTTIDEWIKQIGEMIAKGNRLNFGNDQWKYWTKLQCFCVSILDRLLK